MSAPIKFQDLSISNFDQHLEVEGISGGTFCCIGQSLFNYLNNLAQRIRESIRGCCPTDCTPVDWCGR